MNRSTLAAAMLLACTVSTAWSISLAPREDSFSTKGKLNVANGKATTLNIGGADKAYVSFSLDSIEAFPGVPSSDGIASATLRIFIGKAKTPGNLTIHKVTSAWSEATAGPEPSIDPTPLATVASGAQTSKDYVYVDITAGVKPAFDAFDTMGFAIVSDAGKLTIPSKESSLPACELNVELINGGGGGLGDGSVMTANLADGAVTEVKIAAGSITSSLIADGTITNADISPGFVFPAGSVADGSITNDKLALGAITASKIVAGSITSALIADGTITNADISPGFVFPAGTIADGSVTTAKLADASVTAAKLAGTVGVFAKSGNNISFTGGNVGIGFVPTDTVPLTIQGGLNQELIEFKGAAGANAFTLRLTSGGLTFNETTPGSSRIFIEPGGNIGLGTIDPTSRLDVRGDIKLGSTGQFFAASGEENLRIVRGFVNANGSINNGSGFTVSRAAAGKYEITLNTPLTGAGIINASGFLNASVTPTINASGTAFFEVDVYDSFGVLVDSRFQFIIVGPR